MEFGEIKIEFLGHAGFLIKHKRTVLIIDPYHVSENLPKADILLITHGHYDHCSIKDILKVVKPGTLVFCPPDCQSSVLKCKDVVVQPVEPHDVLRFSDFKIECVPAYNKSGKPHSRQEGWLGFLLNFKKNIIYFSGDTDDTIEIERLSGHGKNGNNFLTVLPVSGGVTMDAKTAAQVAKKIKSTLAIPSSYGAGVYGSEEDANNFVNLCQRYGVNAQKLDRYVI